MTEYHVQELAGLHQTDKEKAEDMAAELAEITGTPYAVYVLVSTMYPRKAA